MMWSELPPDLLRLIANCLVTLKDQVRFGCVCTSWRSILPTIRRSHPWCLLYRYDRDEIHEKFVSLHERKVHHVEFIAEVLGRSRFYGSSHSWLVAIDDASPRISLYNPFTKVLIALPPRNNFPDVRRYCKDEAGFLYQRDYCNATVQTKRKIKTLYELETYNNDGQIEVEIVDANFVHGRLIGKLVPSSAPTKPNCMVAAIYGLSQHNLAYCKLGDERWTCIDKGTKKYDDVIFDDQNLVYAVTCTSHMHIFDLSSNSPKLVDTIQSPPQQQQQPRPGQWPGDRHNYLVKTSIGLLLVERHWICAESLEEGGYRQETKIFNLYMYKPSSRSWCKVENMGENVLFLGLNASISIPSSCLQGYKGNHIYFTDSESMVYGIGSSRQRQGPYEIGVYNLDDTSVQCLHRYYIEEEYLSWPTLIWYIHSPQDFFDEQL